MACPFNPPYMRCPLQPCLQPMDASALGTATPAATPWSLHVAPRNLQPVDACMLGSVTPDCNPRPETLMIGLPPLTFPARRPLPPLPAPPSCPPMIFLSTSGVYVLGQAPNWPLFRVASTRVAGADFGADLDCPQPPMPRVGGAYQSAYFGPFTFRVGVANQGANHTR